MIVAETIEYDVVEQINFLLVSRFPQFKETLYAGAYVGDVWYAPEDFTSEDELREYYTFGCYQNARGAGLDSIPDVAGNPFVRMSAEAGWMAMQDIQYRGGQVLPGDNQYE